MLKQLKTHTEGGFKIGSSRFANFTHSNNNFSSSSLSSSTGAEKYKIMSKTKVLVFSGYGLNCEQETQEAFRLSGADAEIVHINDFIDGIKNSAAEPSYLNQRVYGR